jgi:hypothetical protein
MTLRADSGSGSGSGFRFKVKFEFTIAKGTQTGKTGEHEEKT